MGLGKILFYGSILTSLLSAPKIANAEEICNDWDLSAEINLQTLEFKADKTVELPCSIDPGYRSWDKKYQILNHDGIRGLIKIEYKSPEGKRYYEFFEPKEEQSVGKLRGLVTDKVTLNW